MIDPSSPLFNLSVLETALKGTTDPAERVKLLGGKVHLLTPEPSSREINTSLLSARLDLADTYISLSPPDYHSAAAEAAVVETECKRSLKRADSEDVKAIRKRAVLILATTEDGLGRASRAERWTQLARDM